MSTLLGVVLAFITVMLLLSLVVMALVQATQSLLRLRSRNLLVGVSALVQSTDVAKALPAPSASPLRRSEHVRKAAEVLNVATAQLAPVENPNSIRNIIRGPQVAWVDPNDLARAIVTKNASALAAGKELPPAPGSLDKVIEDSLAGGPVSESPDTLSNRFRKLEPALTDRFTTIVRWWTIGWAIVVAIFFQVSTPDLLNSLATSETRREAIIAMVPEVTRQAESAAAYSSEDFVDRALARLAQDYPSREDTFAEVSGSTDSREEMLEELRNVLTGDSERDTIVNRYAAIIDDLSTADLNTAVANAGTAIDALEVIDIRLWGQGDTFYGTLADPRWQNIVGVLLTAILLTFGAPFWYEQLKNVATLRNALSTKRSP